MVDGEVSTQHLPKTSSTGRRFPMVRRIIESSESEDVEASTPVKIAPKSLTRKILSEDFIELTSSSEDEVSRSTPTVEHTSQAKFPSFVTEAEDGAVLILCAVVFLS